MVAAALVVAVLTVLAVVSDDHFRIWLEDTAPLAEWLVAGGTAALALATYTLARRAADEAQAVRDEAKIVADQVTLQRQQAEAAQRPIVYPITPVEWASGQQDFGGGRLIAIDTLPVANGGPGVALNVMGHLLRRVDEHSAAHRSSQILAGSIGPGKTAYARLEDVWDEWSGTIGYLRYWDLLGNEWLTDFSCSIAVGNQLSIEARPPRRAESPGVTGYPPPEWSTSR